MCHNYYFLNTYFHYFSCFLPQDYTLGLTAGFKIHVRHNYNFVNNCFEYFSYFLLQDVTKGLTTGSRIYVWYNYNFLNTCFHYFSYFLLQDSTKGLNSFLNPFLLLLQFSKYFFQLVFLLPSSRWYNELKFKRQNPSQP